MYSKKFYTLLDYVFADEGGYNNIKDDRGGPTNFGVSQVAMNEYTRKRNLPFKSVKTLTKDEATKVLYEDYYLISGADKQQDIRDAYILFDTAVNFHPVTSKIMFKQASGNFYKMLEIRFKEHIKEVEKDPRQQKFEQGWIDRVKRIEKRADELIRDPEYKPDYSDDVTPFDDDYSGGLKNPDISDPVKRESLKNKYQYLLNKNGKATGFAADVDEVDTRTDSQKFSDQIRGDFHRMRAERNRRVLGRNHPGNYGKNNSSGSGKGRWVTIRGHHVFIED